MKKPSFVFLNDDTCRVRELIYEGPQFGSLSKTEVFAYYASPGTLYQNAGKEKRWPGIVLVHGGGGKAFKEWVVSWAEKGYAAIAMDLAGNGLNGDRLQNGGPGQEHLDKFKSIDGPLDKQWVYHAVSNVIRAHSLLRNLPFTDSTRTAITGISWGGFLTCIVIGLDNRFKAAVPVYGCGYIDQPDGVFGNAFKDLSDEKHKEWMQQYDPSQYIGRSSLPIFWVTGAKDHYYQPSIYALTYRLVRKSSSFKILPDMKHSHPAGWEPPEIEAFISSKLKNTAPLTEIKKIKRNKDLTVSYNRKLRGSCSISYSNSDNIPFEKRDYVTIQGVIKNGKAHLPCPPKDAKLIIITTTDERGLTTSSEYFTKDALFSQRYHVPML